MRGGGEAAGNERAAHTACGEGGPGLCPLWSCVPPQGTAASTKNKLPGLITSMETVGAKALEDFADNIKVTPSFHCHGQLAVGRATSDLWGTPPGGRRPSRMGLPKGHLL